MIEQSKVVRMRSEESTENKIAIEGIKHEIKSIRDETNIHNRQTEKEFASIHKKIDKIDNRLWAVAALIIATTFGKLLADMFMT